MKAHPTGNTLLVPVVARVSKFWMYVVVLVRLTQVCAETGSASASNAATAMKQSLARIEEKPQYSNGILTNLSTARKITIDLCDLVLLHLGNNSGRADSAVNIHRALCPHSDTTCALCCASNFVFT